MENKVTLVWTEQNSIWSVSTANEEVFNSRLEFVTLPLCSIMKALRLKPLKVCLPCSFLCNTRGLYCASLSLPCCMKTQRWQMWSSLVRWPRPCAKHGEVSWPTARTANRTNRSQLAQLAKPVFVVLPEKGTEPPNLLEKLQGLQTLHLPEQSSQTWGLRALHFWHFVVSLMQEAGGNGQCDWIMKVPVSSYVKCALTTLESRLSWLQRLGAVLLLSSGCSNGGLQPRSLMGPDVALHVSKPTGWCRCESGLLRPCKGMDGPLHQTCRQYWSSIWLWQFLRRLHFFPCAWSDLGHITVGNYADMETSFVLFERPNHTIQMFEKHADTLKKLGYTFWMHGW